MGEGFWGDFRVITEHNGNAVIEFRGRNEIPPRHGDVAGEHPALGIETAFGLEGEGVISRFLCVYELFCAELGFAQGKVASGLLGGFADFAEVGLQRFSSFIPLGLFGVGTAKDEPVFRLHFRGIGLGGELGEVFNCVGGIACLKVFRSQPAKKFGWDFRFGFVGFVDFSSQRGAIFLGAMGLEQ